MGMQKFTRKWEEGGDRRKDERRAEGKRKGGNDRGGRRGWMCRSEEIKGKVVLEEIN